MSVAEGIRQMDEVVAPERLAAAVDAVSSALVVGDGCLPEGARQRARRVLAKVDERLAISGGHTVVALAGATGSGKSSLFNDLVGADVSEVGARRPTTATPTAAIWGDADADVLLDWLRVGRRHRVTARAGDAQAAQGPLQLSGLLLLDLPDFDSRIIEHRAEADRILELVDVFVWVTDPQKYADARLHDDYVMQLAGHEAKTIVVLNQVDHLTPEALVVCRDDLQRLLTADGVPDARVVVTSASTGAGVVDLMAALAEAVQARNAARQRLLGDLRVTAAALRSGVADTEPDLATETDETVVDALSRAAGVPAVLGAVEDSYRREAALRTGWPFTRWVRRLRPAPLQRLGLDRTASAAPEVSDADVLAVLGRSSLPRPTPAATAAVSLATRAVGHRAASGLPTPWAQAVADAASPPGHDLADALDQAVLSTSLRTSAPAWWVAVGLAQWIAAVAALVGILWLTVLGLLDWLQLPEVEPPRVGVVPSPLLLAGGGLIAGYLLSALSRVAARVGGRRRRQIVERRLRAAIGAVAHERILAPVRAVVDRHRRTRELLDGVLRA